jgi:hypothetical protein
LALANKSPQSELEAGEALVTIVLKVDRGIRVYPLDNELLGKDEKKK